MPRYIQTIDTIVNASGQHNTHEYWWSEAPSVTSKMPGSRPDVSVRQTPVSCRYLAHKATHEPILLVWHRGIVIRHMNKVTLCKVSTGMGDRLRAGIPPRYVIKPTRSTQPCIPSGSLN